jgi:outer membrane protein
LEESYKLALKNNQVEAINNAKINQFSEQIIQGKSGYYPKLYFKGNYSKQENLADIRYANLNLTHSIYRAGKDVVTTNLANNSKEIAVLNKSTEELNLYQNVINSYYNFYLYSNDVQNLELLTKQSNDRVLEIQKRVSIGRSRTGELLQAKAQLAQAQALYQNASGLLKEAKEKFVVLVGVTDVTPMVDMNIPLNHYSIDEILLKAFKRSDVLAKELKIDEASLNLSFARRNHLPTIDLTSNYYLNKRTGTVYTKTDWDAGVVLTFPLFEGFNSDAKVNENIWKEHEARFSFLDMKKNIESDIVSKLETHNRYVEQITSFDSAQSLAKKSYDESVKDYRLGLISNLDVLTALNLYLDSKRNFEKNKIMAIMSEKILDSSMGVMP